jgi:hypothetical protein
MRLGSQYLSDGATFRNFPRPFAMAGYAIVRDLAMPRLNPQPGYQSIKISQLCEKGTLVFKIRRSISALHGAKDGMYTPVNKFRNQKVHSSDSSFEYCNGASVNSNPET